MTNVKNTITLCEVSVPGAARRDFSRGGFHHSFSKMEIVPGNPTKTMDQDMLFSGLSQNPLKPLTVKLIFSDTNGNEYPTTATFRVA